MTDRSFTQPIGMPLVRRIGETSLKVFPIALSGATFGWTAGEQATQSILDIYAALGGNFIVTSDAARS